MNILFILGIVLFIVFFLLVSRKKLDAIIIPTGPSYEVGRERASVAAKRYAHGKGADYLIISGELGDKELKESQRADIYRTLRSYGIKAGDIRIEGKSENSLENLLYSLKKVKKKGIKRVGIASSPSHLDRFRDIFDAAKKQGLIDKGFRLYKIRTKENVKDRISGLFARLFYRYKLAKGVKKAKERKTPGWIDRIRRFLYR